MKLEDYLIRKQFLSILFATEVVFDEKSDISLYELASFIDLINEFKFKFCIDENMKNNLFNFLDQIRFKDENKTKFKNICINALINSVNHSKDYRIIDFYREELYKRTNKKNSFLVPKEYIYEILELLKSSICLDSIILQSHLLDIDDSKFKKTYMDKLITSGVYIESINCILAEYPILFEKPIFRRRVDLILNEVKTGKYDKAGKKQAKKTLKKIKKISVSTN